MTLNNRQVVKKGISSVIIAIVINSILVLVKALAGYFGNSYALIADAVESASDIFISIVVIIGLKFASKPPDRNHPYGHGKFEPLAGSFVAFFLILIALLIVIQSIKEILTPHHSPEPFTLLVLAGVVLVKEYLFRFIIKVGSEIESSALKADAWHQRSDAITSAAVFIGILVAVVGGKGYESADDFAALLAAGIIIINAIILLKPALFELIDSAPNPEIVSKVRKIAESVDGVLGTHKCHIRKVGFSFYADLDVLCDPDQTIRQGHEIAHNVGEAIQQQIPEIAKVLVHIEPCDDYGRRSRDNLGV